ncbi:hypothetical protein [Pedobacter agri]|uniref:hypothetical protein n=1 Tax=Pedobacter agri TaxID=454586 RepID=UPI00292E2CDA|nr:hypothetical protein [Pedobacter agri]
MMRSILILAFVLFILSGCRKDERITDDPNVKLTFSKDSILFDTVFTSVGSVVKRVKIINKNSSAVNISDIVLASGNASSFSVNINGEYGTSRRNIIVTAGDSINLFVKATINPSVKALPFIVQDSILITTNGNTQSIQLQAYGQNAVFINASSITTHTLWTNNLPYIINGAVTVRNNSSLTILPGARIYFHTDASLNIEGRLTANGQLDKPILFCSDRLESIFADVPGQWRGINFKGTGSGLISYTTIKNASVGITSDSLSVNTIPKLIMSNSIIKNMQVAGYIGYHSELIAFNNLFYNCGNYLVYGVGGGHYNLKQNTFAGFNIYFPRKTAALTFSDYQSAKMANSLNLNLTNNIIWGTLNNELEIEKKTNANSQVNILNNLIKTANSLYSNNGNILNLNPDFIAPSLENFELSNTSLALKKGFNLSTDVYFKDYLHRDLKNTMRVFPSSLGCFEKK